MLYDYLLYCDDSKSPWDLSEEENSPLPEEIPEIVSELDENFDLPSAEDDEYFGSFSLGAEIIM